MGMAQHKSNNKKTVVKASFHKRNPHQGTYDFDVLVKHCPELKEFIIENKYGNTSIDFANPDAVKLLNKALLFQHYLLSHWDIPAGYLCPPMPGRADYIHHIADILAGNNFGQIPTGDKVSCVDIGVGANCVYPIIGHQSFQWQFIGSEIDEIALANAQEIVTKNQLHDGITLLHQANTRDILYGVLNKEIQVDVTMCNPPFHASSDDATKGTNRKVKNLSGENPTETKLNFGGQANELWCVGGEKQFVKNMIRQSKNFAKNCLWFTTLVSKKDHLAKIYQLLKDAEVTDVRTINMGQGNKQSRIVAWTFMSNTEQNNWREQRWKN
jgi:23S rRNA (adenine1618-N6)-methyltransferase